MKTNFQKMITGKEAVRTHLLIDVKTILPVPIQVSGGGRKVWKFSNANIFADDHKAIHHRHRTGTWISSTTFFNERGKLRGGPWRKSKILFESLRPYSVRQAWTKSTWLTSVRDRSLLSKVLTIVGVVVDSRPWQIRVDGWWIGLVNNEGQPL